jgi:hypothetical protein
VQRIGWPVSTATLQPPLHSRQRMVGRKPDTTILDAVSLNPIVAWPAKVTNADNRNANDAYGTFDIQFRYRTPSAPNDRLTEDPKRVSYEQAK